MAKIAMAVLFVSALAQAPHLGESGPGRAVFMALLALAFIGVAVSHFGAKERESAQGGPEDA